MPRAPAARARTRLSVRSWRTIRPRPAPIADRTVISRRRLLPRARVRLATLTQAMRRTKPTAPSRTTKRTLTTSQAKFSASRSGLTVTPSMRPSASG